MGPPVGSMPHAGNLTAAAPLSSSYDELASSGHWKFTAGARVNEWTQKGEWSARKTSSRREHYRTAGGGHGGLLGVSQGQDPVQMQRQISLGKPRGGKNEYDEANADQSEGKIGDLNRPKTSIGQNPGSRLESKSGIKVRKNIGIEYFDDVLLDGMDGNANGDDRVETRMPPMDPMLIAGVE